MRRESRRATGTVQMTLTDAGMSAKLVIEAVSIGKAYGDRSIVKDFSVRILRGDRIGIVGANGAGDDQSECRCAGEQTEEELTAHGGLLQNGQRRRGVSSSGREWSGWSWPPWSWS